MGLRWRELMGGERTAAAGREELGSKAGQPHDGQRRSGAARPRGAGDVTATESSWWVQRGRRLLRALALDGMRVRVSPGRARRAGQWSQTTEQRVGLAASGSSKAQAHQQPRPLVCSARARLVWSQSGWDRRRKLPGAARERGGRWVCSTEQRAGEVYYFAAFAGR